MADQATLERLKIVVLCVAWYSFSSGNGVVGKLVLSDFPYPMTLSMVQLLSISLYLIPFLWVWNVPRMNQLPLKYWFTMILPLVVGKFFASVSSHISIWKVPVSYAHTVKATMPFFTVIITRFFFGEKHTLKIYVCLLPIIGGVALATVTELRFDVIGLVSALVATLGFALLNILSKKCLKETGIHHLRLLVVIARISAVCFFPLWLMHDGVEIWADTSLWRSSHTPRLLALLVIDGALNTAQNVVAFTVISMVTPLSYAIANATKRIVIISVSLLTLRNPVTTLNVVGMSTAIFGVFLYNQAKLEQAREKERLPTTVDPTNQLLRNNNVSPSTNHIVFQGHKTLLSPNGDARTPDMYKAFNGYRVV